MRSLLIVAAIATLGSTSCKSAGEKASASKESATPKGSDDADSKGKTGKGGSGGAQDPNSPASAEGGAAPGAPVAEGTDTSGATAGGQVIATQEDVGEPTPIKTYEPSVEERSVGEILCQETPRLAESHKDDFTNVVAAVCDDTTTNATYDEVMAKAYAGEGTPEVVVIKSTTDDLYVTHLIFAYAVTIPLPSPDMVADLNIFGALEAGLSDDTSKMTFKVDSRTEFPGKGSLEEVRVSYRTLLADGAALYDTRQTYSNQYLPSEGTRDITVTLESLLDPESNEHYHVSRQMAVGLKNAENTTTMLYVAEMVVKNRIDPARLQRSLINLTKVLAKTTYDVATATKN